MSLHGSSARFGSTATNVYYSFNLFGIGTETLGNVSGPLPNKFKLEPCRRTTLTNSDLNGGKSPSLQKSLLPQKSQQLSENWVVSQTAPDPVLRQLLRHSRKTLGSYRTRLAAALDWQLVVLEPSPPPPPVVVVPQKIHGGTCPTAFITCV